MCAKRRKSIFFRTQHPMPNTEKNYISQLIAQIAINVVNTHVFKKIKPCSIL
jgi:hypothetical protein